MNNSYDLAVLIAGPDTNIEFQDNLHFLNQHAEKTIIIGDGKSNILNTTNGQGIYKDILLNLHTGYPQFTSQPKTLLYVMMHGTEIDSEHYVQVGNASMLPYSTEYFFADIGYIFNKPLDIIFTPCHGKAALKYIEKLPFGSKVLFFSENDGLTVSANHKATQEILTKYDHWSINSYYDNYLANLGMRENPIIAVSGGNITDPYAIKDRYLGKKITPEMRDYTHKNFAYNVCREDMSCHNKIEQVIDKIEQVTDIDYFNTNNNKFMNLRQKYKFDEYVDFSNSTTNTTDFKIAYQEKDKFDQAMATLSLPLERNLADPALYEDDEEDDASLEMIFQIMETHSERGIVNLLTYSDLTTINDKFPMPEYAEYGLVLGIINDLEKLNHS